MKFNWHYLQTQLAETDVDMLIADCEAWQQTADLTDTERDATRLIQSALMLSAHILRHDKSALAHQLVGRLMRHRATNRLIHSLTDEIAKLPNHLFPVNLDSDFPPLLPAGWSLANLFRHNTHVEGVIQARDGRFLSWDYGFTLYLWSKDGKLLKLLKKHRQEIVDVIEMGDGSFLSITYFPSSENSEFFLWDSEGDFLREISMDEFKSLLPDYKIQPSPKQIETHDGQFLATWEERHILLWHKDMPRQLYWTQHKSDVKIYLTQDGNILSYANHDKDDTTLRLWDTQGNLLNSGIGHTESIIFVHQTYEGLFLSSSADKTLRLWDSQVNPIKICHAEARMWYIEETTDGRFLTKGWLAIRADDGTLHIYNDDKLFLWDEDVHLIKILAGNTEVIDDIIQTKYGDYLGWENSHNYVKRPMNLYLWDRDGNLLQVLSGHTNDITGVIRTRDGRYLSYSADKTIRMWDENLNLVKVMTEHTDKIVDVQELKNGHFVSEEDEGNILHWDADGNLLGTISEKSIGHVIEIDDDRYVSGFRSRLFLWDKNWNLLDTLEIPTERDKKSIWAWAHQHHFDPMLMYPEDSVIGKYRLCSYLRSKIEIYNPQTGETIHTFYADSPFCTRPIIIPADDHYLIIFGDVRGRVLFLRWREA